MNPALARYKWHLYSPPCQFHFPYFCLFVVFLTSHSSGMNFGIIGTGAIAHTHAKAVQAIENSRLHSIYHPDEGKAHAFAENYHCKPVSDLHRFLDDGELEAVLIATPSGAHLEPTIAALEAGKHVFCEKPLEISLERMDRMIDAATSNGKTLAAILNRRFHPAMDAFKKACEQNRFGKLVSASCYVKWFRDQAYYDSAPWRGTKTLDGGGALMNQSIHAIDSLLHLAGPVRWVQASIACLAHERIEVEDTAVAILEFTNGALGVIEGSTACWSPQGQPVRIQLCGTEGSVFMADETFETWEFKKPLPEDDVVRSTLMKNAHGGLGANDPKAIGYLQHQRNIEEIVTSIHEGREPSTSAVEAKKAVALIEAIYQSAATGERVYL